MPTTYFIISLRAGLDVEILKRTLIYSIRFPCYDWVVFTSRAPQVFHRRTKSFTNYFAFRGFESTNSQNAYTQQYIVCKKVALNENGRRMGLNFFFKNRSFGYDNRNERSNVAERNGTLNPARNRPKMLNVWTLVGVHQVLEPFGLATAVIRACYFVFSALIRYRIENYFRVKNSTGKVHRQYWYGYVITHIEVDAKGWWVYHDI